MAEQVVVVVAAETTERAIKTMPVVPVGAIRNIKQVAAHSVLWVRQVVRELSVKAEVAVVLRQIQAELLPEQAAQVGLKAAVAAVAALVLVRAAAAVQRAVQAVRVIALFILGRGLL
jgi:hypothetical protein